MNASSRRAHATLVAVAGTMALMGGMAAARVTDTCRRIPIERTARAAGAVVARAPQPGDSCAGGGRRAADVEIVPDAVLLEGGRERIEYHGEVAVHRGQNVGVAWEATVVDDRGRVMGQSLDRGAARRQRGEVAFTKALLATLPDGYYALRVRAAVSPPDEPVDIVESVRYLEVKGARWGELTDLEWFARSRANQVFTEAELKGRSL